MKRRSLWVVAVTLMIALIAAGCGQGGDKGGSGGAEAKVYKFATDAQYAPMEFMDKGKVAGFDVEFLDIVMKEAGLKYDIVNTGWDPMLASVQQGTEYDAGISSVSITEERKQTYDYSMPYFESINMILVKQDSPVQSALDLKNKKVGVQISTTADTLMTEIMGQNNADLKRFDSNTVALLELEGGGVDAVVADIAIVREYVKNNPDKNFKEVADAANFTPEYYGILLPKGSELKALLDPAIKAVIENGKYTEVYKKWFGEEPNTDNLLNAE
ncbi:glutamine ABC transporter substrate-binding protein [Paenibacillus darwinianus]|uniref:Glutamine ABC transporter substrate-binding protein n=1 Tax=Paenibacillus darwinianus TaxID=1380763 RepID=A0A9W5S018_9BACL|nr:basic amino acid ABC transporter substrate-binding protein [Paenibacillus darwinianus]EXX85924.1 glutamine ABC transporter substrate-binding protein [Paenibacillus darwinianus]EXX86851.1 glutamine ABC transporter substrate-binding protein [Paenibacillus darwinianus]EXX88022.1 glutamine ABC transporter substrate-binding protein [Paenibacillus darwinianus]